MKITDRYSEIPGGPAVAANTPVTLHRASNGQLLDTQHTDADGFVTFTINGSPGYTYTQIVYNGHTRRRYGRTHGQMGKIAQSDMSEFFRIFTPGRIPGIGNGLTVTPGTGLQVIVSTGAAAGGGQIHTQHTSQVMNLASNTSGVTRTDSVIIRLCNENHGTTPGATFLELIQGNGAPVAAANEVVVILGVITVNNNASSITSGQITAGSGSISLGSQTLSGGAIQNATLPSTAFNSTVSEYVSDAVNSLMVVQSPLVKVYDDEFDILFLKSNARPTMLDTFRYGTDKAGPLSGWFLFAGNFDAAQGFDSGLDYIIHLDAEIVFSTPASTGTLSANMGNNASTGMVEIQSWSNGSARAQDMAIRAQRQWTVPKGGTSTPYYLSVSCPSGWVIEDSTTMSAHAYPKF